MTSIILKVIASALKSFPQFNASIDMENGEVIYKNYINIGVAVDTDRGLLVPVIKDAEEKNITELSVELSQLSEKARNKKISVDELQGGTFTISNLGGIGGTYFSPVVNAPEVAILGISRSAIEPVYKDGGFLPRLMLPLMQRFRMQCGPPFLLQSQVHLKYFLRNHRPTPSGQWDHIPRLSIRE